ncbi:MAG: CPBP family intramembrane metalloprotease [Acidobacteriia bacterium]|nr:CPBP family intramembrane metalloprotease [Terriglobia bacterium]
MSEEPFSSNPASPPSRETPPEPGDPLHIPEEPAAKPAFWTGWDALVLLALFIAGTLFATLLCQMGYLALEGLYHWPPLKPRELGTNPYIALIAQLLVYILLLTFLYFLITRKYELDFLHSLRLLKLPSGVMRSFGLLGLLLAVMVMILSSLFPSTKETPLEKILSQGHAIYYFAAFAILIAPFTEELIFRGFLYPIFENRGGPSVAVVVTALIFSGLHVFQLWGSWPAIGLIVLVGFVLSLTRAVTGLLTPCWIIHFVYNTTLVMAVVVAKAMAHSPQALR